MEGSCPARWLTVTIVLALTAMTGCGSSPLIKCRGQVLLDGKPVSNATVAFVPKDGSHLATGKTDAEGRFRLGTFEADDGAYPGEHTVTVTAFEVVRPKPKAGARIDDEQDEVPLKWVVPEKYSKVKTSGLTATVSSSSCEFKFDLPK